MAKHPPLSPVLIATRKNLEQAGALHAAGNPLIAGTLHITNLLAAQGIPAVSGATLLSPADKRAVLEEVAALARAFDDIPSPDPLTAILRADIIRALFTHSGFRRADAHLGQTITWPDGTPAHDPQPILLRSSPGPVSGERAAAGHAVKRRKVIFDFRSRSGLKLASGQSLPHVRPLATRNPAWLNTAENWIAAARGRPSRTLKFSVPHLSGENPFPPLPRVEDDQTQQMLNRIAAVTTREFRSHRSAMRTLIADGGAPQAALFNNIGNAGLAGFFAALTEAGVPCEMGAHGCLVASGDAARDAVTAILGPIVYNSFPGMTGVAPRSPLQARDAWPGQTIKRQTRTTEPGRRTGSFTILQAPNFQPWISCFHGLSIDCFQTERAVMALAEAVVGLADVSLDIRIKTTAADTAKADQNAFRGLMPDDVRAALNPAFGVRDASTGSHAALMAAADLVVTEGMTAVVFEALEGRCPVLLLGADDLPPALPHCTGKDLVAGRTRAAVYAARPSDDLAAILQAIRAAHHDIPLTDAEIAPYVWTG